MYVLGFDVVRSSDGWERLSAHSRTHNHPSLPFLLDTSPRVIRPKVLMCSFGLRDAVYDFNDQDLASAVTSGPVSQGVRGVDVNRQAMVGQQKQSEGSQSLRSKFWS